jgi:hypothetical protein
MRKSSAAAERMTTVRIPARRGRRCGCERRRLSARRAASSCGVRSYVRWRGHSARGRDILAGWVDRLRPFKSEIRSLLVEYAEGIGSNGNPVDIARAAAAVGAAIGVLSAGGRLCSCCHRIDRCFEREDGLRVCRRCAERSEPGSA